MHNKEIYFIFAFENKGTMLISTYRRVITAMLVGCLFCTSAYSQRTADKQNAMTASPGITDGSVSLGFDWLQYSLIGYGTAGVRCSDYARTLSSVAKIGYTDICAEGGYMFRLISSRSRAISLYAGGGGFLGYEVVDPMRRLPEHIVLNVRKRTFLYGIYAAVEAEVFFVEKVALVFQGILPVNFVSQLGKVHYECGAGLRVNF